MLPGFGRSHKSRMIKSVSFISLCFPFCSGQGRDQTMAWTLTLSLGDTKYLMPLTCFHMCEPLYNSQGLGENDIAYPVTGIAEQSSALLGASIGKNNKGLINFQGQLPRSRGPVPKAEPGPCGHQLCPVLPSAASSFSSCLSTIPLNQCLSKYLAGCSGRCLRHQDGEG